MQKIISLFQRNYNGNRLVRNEITPSAEWVANGEGVATRKWDGTCCLFRDGKLFKRYDSKRGKAPPPGFEPAQEPDPKTGHWPGWMPVGDGPEDCWHREAWARALNEVDFPDGTYELIGPKVNGNPEGALSHLLFPHACCPLSLAPRDFDGLKFYLAEYGYEGHGIEGIVWHHPDGRMVKIKAKDFGLKRRCPR